MLAKKHDSNGEDHVREPPPVEMETGKHHLYIYIYILRKNMNVVVLWV